MEATIIGTLSVVLLAISVIYAGRQLQLLRRQHSEDHDWNRRLAAQQAIDKYHNIQLMVETISEHLDFQNRTEGITLADIEAKFKETGTLQTRVHSVINYFEAMARGVRQGIYDEEVIKNAFQGHMNRVYESFRYYIESRRRNLHNPQIWIELEEISDKWRKELRAVEPRRDPIASRR